MKRPKSAAVPSASTNKRKSQKDETGDVTQVTEAGGLVKHCYGRSRSHLESLRAGERVDYIYPSRYDGRAAVTIDGDDGVVIEKAVPSVWNAVADWLLARDINPEAYIDMQFSAIGPGERIPEPAQLITPKCLKRWETGKRMLEERARISVIVEKQIAEGAYAMWNSNIKNPKGAWAYVLADTELALSPLFRYCIAFRMKGKVFDDIADLYESRAIFQFQRARVAYKKYWKAILPKGFSKYAREIYPQLLLRLL